MKNGGFILSKGHSLGVAERIHRDEKTHSDFLRIRKALSLMRTEYWHRRTNGELASLSGVSKDCFEKKIGLSPAAYRKASV